MMFVYLWHYLVYLMQCNVFTRFEVQKTHYFPHTVHYCCSSKPRLSETYRFLQSSSVWEPRCALIGQLSGALLLEEYLKRVMEFVYFFYYANKHTIYRWQIKYKITKVNKTYMTAWCVCVCECVYDSVTGCWGWKYRNKRKYNRHNSKKNIIVMITVIIIIIALITKNWRWRVRKEISNNSNSSSNNIN